MNVNGGGESAYRSEHSVLYYRYSSHVRAPDVKTKEENASKENYFSGIIPRDDKNGIGWHTLVPRWKVILHCGSKQRQRTEASK